MPADHSQQPETMHTNGAAQSARHLFRGLLLAREPFEQIRVLRFQDGGEPGEFSVGERREVLLRPIALGRRRGGGEEGAAEIQRRHNMIAVQCWKVGESQARPRRVWLLTRGIGWIFGEDRHGLCGAPHHEQVELKEPPLLRPVGKRVEELRRETRSVSELHMRRITIRLQ